MKKSNLLLLTCFVLILSTIVSVFALPSWLTGKATTSTGEVNVVKLVEERDYYFGVSGTKHSYVITDVRISGEDGDGSVSFSLNEENKGYIDAYTLVKGSQQTLVKENDLTLYGELVEIETDYKFLFFGKDRVAIVEITSEIPEEEKCTDSDGGLGYYVKGKFSGYWEGEFITNYDSCLDPTDWDDIYSSGYLGEGYCENGKLKTEKYKCPNGCVDGACVKEKNETTTKVVTYQGVLDMLNNKCHMLGGDLKEGESCKDVCLSGETCIFTQIGATNPIAHELVKFAIQDCNEIVGIKGETIEIGCMCCSTP